MSDACCSGCQPIFGDAIITEIDDPDETDVAKKKYLCSIVCDHSSTNNNLFNTFAPVSTANNVNPSIANLLRLRAALGLGINPLFDDEGLDDQEISLPDMEADGNSHNINRGNNHAL